MRNRWQDAYDIQQGASNPIGVCNALLDAATQAAAEGVNPLDDLACRMILHQLSFLMGDLHYEIPCSPGDRDGSAQYATEEILLDIEHLRNRLRYCASKTIQQRRDMISIYLTAALARMMDMGDANAQYNRYMDVIEEKSKEVSGDFSAA